MLFVMKKQKKTLVVVVVIITAALLLAAAWNYTREEREESLTGTGETKMHRIQGIEFPASCVIDTEATDWDISCPGVSTNARGYVDVLAKKQGWKYCAGDAVSASWWKNGILMTVSEGSGLEPFELEQKPAKGCF